MASQCQREWPPPLEYLLEEKGTAQLLETVERSVSWCLWHGCKPEGAALITDANFRVKRSCLRLINLLTDVMQRFVFMCM